MSTFEWLSKSTIALMLLVLGAWPGQSRADELDVVLDVLAKAGVIDGNVKAAKPLIFCLADGKSVEVCTLGAANQSELAQDPQVRNVIDIYLAYRGHDWYGLVKRAGVTVGCALVPGGEIKDALCSELGKVAISIVNGIGDMMSSISSGLGSLACGIIGGCEEELPPPMPAEDSYRLFFAPTYHRLLMAKDAEDGSYQQLLSALNVQCQQFYLAQYSQDGGACASNCLRLKKTVDLLDQTLRDEGESRYALKAQPKLEAWAYDHFGQDSSAWVNAQVSQCRSDISKSVPMPSPYGRCDYIGAQAKQYASAGSGSAIEAAMAKLQQQCMAEMSPYAIAPPQDIYAVACEPVLKKTPFAAIAAMNVWKQRMDKASAAGCSNNGTPASVQCPDFESFLACNKNVPEKRSICGTDRSARLAHGVYEKLSFDSAKAGKPARCVREGDSVRCARPVKAQGCRSYMTLYSDLIGTPGAADSQCGEAQDPEYDQQRQLAQTVVAALNGTTATTTTVLMPAIRSLSPNNAPANDGPLSRAVIGAVRSNVVRALPSTIGACRTEAPDWLRIRCQPGFVWDADPGRTQTVTQLLGQPLSICANDPELDGADAPCLDGMPVEAFPGQK